ncbi:MAG: hypothetical protein ACRD4U_11435 [Candidatus Acidiferrales bacterium]
MSALLLALLVPFAPLRAAQGEQATGWVCGIVVDETYAQVAEAELKLFPAPASAAAAEPVATAVSEAHGGFCLQDLAPGFYELEVSKPPWPPQPTRSVEIRAGLMNRLNPIELELEPTEPRVSFEESFDGMSPGQARAALERLMHAGDSASLREAARRLLPKKGVRIEIGRMLLGIDPKPLVEEVIRQVESGPLPPLKTARYLHVLGELVDPRTEANVMRLLLQKLRDSRVVPSPPSMGAADRTVYVGDVAIEGVARLAGKDFKWRYGVPPMQNQSAIQGAFTWWAQEQQRRDSRNKQ